MVYDNEKVGELVRRAQAGDLDAKGELAELFQPTVYRWMRIRRLQDADALELTQEVFIAVITKLDQVKDPHCFKSWIQRVVTGKLSDWNRRMKRRKLLQEFPDTLAALPDLRHDQPEGEAMKNELRDRIREALDGLREPYRTILKLRTYKHQKYGRIAKKMSRTAEDVRKLYSRGLRMLRKRLERLKDALLS